MSSVHINNMPMATPVVESNWKKAGRLIGYAALGVVVIGAGMQLHNSWSSNNAQANIVSQLEEVAKKTVDLCQDQFFGDKLCKGNLGIPRMNMPQIEGEALTNYVESLANQNVSVTHEVINPKYLKATQSEMHSGKILSIVRAIIDKRVDICSSPILVARDWVVDGHHRFAACSILDKFQKIIKIDKHIVDVLCDLKSFPGVLHQGLQQVSK